MTLLLKYKGETSIPVEVEGLTPDWTRSQSVAAIERFALFHGNRQEPLAEFFSVSGDPSSGDTFQIDNAVESFLRGGWFGRGPGEGTVKRILPDSHADFIFAVAAEEFGIVLCLALVALFAFIIVRALTRAMHNDDPFARFAACGLAIMFGTQSAINMAVNLHLIPAKGMTLPFISYGGSSLLSLAYGLGMLLALTRERPRAEILGSRHALGMPA